MKKQQLIPLTLLALLVFALIFRYEVHPSKMIKTDRWAGVTWVMGRSAERPMLEPEYLYSAWRTRKALSYAWVVLTAGSLVWLVKAAKEKRAD